MKPTIRRSCVAFLVAFGVLGSAPLVPGIPTSVAALAMLCATTAALITGWWAFKADRQRRLGWLSIIAGVLVLVVSSLTWNTSYIINHAVPTDPSPWVFASAVCNLLVAAGVIGLLSGSSHEFGRRCLDTLTIAFCCTMMLWSSTVVREHMVPPYGTSLIGSWSIVDEVAFVVSVTTCVLIALAVVVFHRHRTSVAAWPAIGWAITAGTMMSFCPTLFQADPEACQKFVVPLAAGLVGISAAVLSGKTQQECIGPKRYGLHPYVPHAALIISTILVTSQRVVMNRNDPTIAFLMGGMVLLVVCRSHITLQDNESLMKELERSEEKLRQQADHDDLTGLHNRSTFHRVVEHQLRADPPAEVTLAYVDLDAFKSVNDTHGHAVGDELLRQVASRLQSLAPAAPTVARLSGDEFAMVVPPNMSAKVLGQLIVDALQRPFHVHDHRVGISGSVGIATWVPGSPSQSADGLIRMADLAMYEIKHQGRNGLRISSTTTPSPIAEDRVLVPALATALDDQEISPFYQPVIRINDGQLVGFEALARWQHAGLEVVPTRFVSIAERAGLLTKLTDTIADQVCAQLAQWNSSTETAPLRVGINVGGYSLQDPTFTERLVEHTSAHGISPHSLYIEITETLPIENLKFANQTLEELRGHGIDVALDDFGTGYNSMSQLLRLPLTMVKIDRSMMHDIDSEPHRHMVVAGMVDLAHHLNLTVIAEGVEHAAQVKVLRELGVQYAQGYLFGRPRPAESWSGMVNQGCNRHLAASASGESGQLPGHRHDTSYDGSSLSMTSGMSVTSRASTPR